MREACVTLVLCVIGYNAPRSYFDNMPRSPQYLDPRLGIYLTALVLECRHADCSMWAASALIWRCRNLQPLDCYVELTQKLLWELKSALPLWHTLAVDSVYKRLGDMHGGRCGVGVPMDHSWVL